MSTRLTGVFSREDGGRRRVQAHFSIAVADEEAFGRELPGRRQPAQPIFSSTP